jgi:hypothetical protein
LYSGLAPGFAGLYQIDITIPSGVASGPTALEILGGANSNLGPDSDTLESGLQVGTSSSDAKPALRAESGKRPFIHHHRMVRPAAVSEKLP